MLGLAFTGTSLAQMQTTTSVPTVTEQEGNVALARPDAAPAKTEAMAATTESAPAKTEATTTTVAPAPAESSLRFVILALVIVAILFFAMRKRSEPSR